MRVDEALSPNWGFTCCPRAARGPRPAPGACTARRASAGNLDAPREGVAPNPNRGAGEPFPCDRSRILPPVEAENRGVRRALPSRWSSLAGRSWATAPRFTRFPPGSFLTGVASAHGTCGDSATDPRERMGGH